MQVLIVEHNQDLAAIWARFLSRQGLDCTVAATATEAYGALRTRIFDAVVLDIELASGEAFAVADFATYRDPDVPIIAVTARSFFADGTIFELIPNVRSLLCAPLRPDDMAALVEHYGRKHVTATQERTASGG